MIFTTLSFLSKPYLSGYKCDRNIHFFQHFQWQLIILKMGVDSRCVITQKVYTGSTGPGKPEVDRDSIWVALAFTEPVIPIQIPFILIRTSDVMAWSNTYGRIIKHLGRRLAADLVVFTRIHWCIHAKILGQGVGITTVPYTREITHSESLPGHQKPGILLQSSKSYVAWQGQPCWVEFSQQ